MLFYLKFMFVFILFGFTADWLFYLKASHARGKAGLEQSYARALCAREVVLPPLHYVFSPTVTTSFPRSNDKSAVYRGRRRLRRC